MMSLMATWGFTYKTLAFVLTKPGRPGFGYWTRAHTEVCLFGTRGKPQQMRANVEDPVKAPRGRHSVESH